MGMMTRRNQKVRMAQKAVLAKKSVAKEEPIETKVDEVVIDNNENVVDDNNKVDNVEVSFYTKTDINTMNVANLRKLAKEQGIEDADNISGTKLKEMLIANMGL